MNNNSSHQQKPEAHNNKVTRAKAVMKWAAKPAKSLLKWAMRIAAYKFFKWLINNI